MYKLRKSRQDAMPPSGTSEKDLLTCFGAARVDIPRGFWVYALHESDGTIFYVGKSGKLGSSPLIRRLADHLAKHKDRIAYVSVMRCRDEYQMESREQLLIDEIQPAECIDGTLKAARHMEASMAASRKVRGQGNAWPSSRAKGTGT